MRMPTVYLEVSALRDNMNTASIKKITVRIVTAQDSNEIINRLGINNMNVAQEEILDLPIV